MTALSIREGRAGRVTTLLALAASPTAWILQLVAGYGLASHACRPGSAPRARPPAFGWGAEGLIILCLDLACLALAMAGGFAALTAWGRSRQEKDGEGAARFLAACGMMAAAGFALAILFDIFSPFVVPSCWRFAP